jgi:hypothetical protein
MPRIVEELAYNGVLQKIDRLDLNGLLNEVRQILAGFKVPLLEEKDANGGAELRKRIDARFEAAGGWTGTATGSIDWVKCHSVNGSRICIGVEIQVSARSDLLFRDIVHFRSAIAEGIIDVCVLIVPSDRLCTYLTDRCPSLSDAKRCISESRGEDLPLLVVAIEHDGPGPALRKQCKRRRKK